MDHGFTTSWKAVFVKVDFASLGFEPRTFSYPGRCATNTQMAKHILQSWTMFPHSGVLLKGILICSKSCANKRLEGVSGLKSLQSPVASKQGRKLISPPELEVAFCNRRVSASNLKKTL